MNEAKQGSKLQHTDENSDSQLIDLPLLRKEVDALQVAILGQRTPWYKNISVLISLIALLFSFGTTFVSYTRTQSQDIQNDRVELRGLLQRLASIPRENVEIVKKYQDDPATVATIGGFLNQENTLPARQAAELANRIPPEYVSATEYYAIALAMQNAYNVQGAMELFTKAIDTSQDFNDRIGALRTRANLLFMTGQPEAWRVDYRRALNVFSDFGNIYHDYTKESTHIWTELSWAISEASIDLKDIALQHVMSAESRLSRLPSSPGADQLRGQINQTKALLFQGHNLPIPPGRLPPSGPTSPDVLPTR